MVLAEKETSIIDNIFRVLITWILFQKDGNRIIRLVSKRAGEDSIGKRTRFLIGGNMATVWSGMKRFSIRINDVITSYWIPRKFSFHFPDFLFPYSSKQILLLSELNKYAPQHIPMWKTVLIHEVHVSLHTVGQQIDSNSYKNVTQVKLSSCSRTQHEKLSGSQEILFFLLKPTVHHSPHKSVDNAEATKCSGSFSKFLF
jgi:hypothetical protein